MSALHPSSLAARLRTTLLVVGAVQLLVVGAALALFLSMREEQDKVTSDYFLTVRDSQDGFARVLELESAAVSYLRGGDPQMLAEYRRLQQPREGAPDAGELERRLDEAPAAVTALGETRERAEEWFAIVEERIAAVEAEGPAAVTPQERTEQRQAFDRLRTQYEDYLDEVLDARDATVQRLERRTSWLFGVVLLAVASSAVAGLLLYEALRRWVTRPVAALAEETRTVRAGDLYHRVSVAGPPEIRALGQDVEAMRLAIVDQLAEVQDTQRQLEEQAEELRRSNRDLEQFAYVASHDLQEPLRKVSSFCQMLERRYKGQLDERADQYIEFAVDGAKRMQLLINDLLTFSRVGRMSEGFTAVPLDDALDEALRNLSAAVEESGAVVTADPLPVVQGERRLLVQLLQNLVGNAVKFRGQEPPRVRIGVRDDGECWELSVSDNGIGIEPQYAERIFVIFQRLHPKADYEGTGIGLALCKKIVEHHGGTIWLDPAPGEGTCFRWTLPKEPAAESRSASDTSGADATAEAPEGAEREAAWTATSR